MRFWDATKNSLPAPGGERCTFDINHYGTRKRQSQYQNASKFYHLATSFFVRNIAEKCMKHSIFNASSQLKQDSGCQDVLRSVPRRTCGCGTRQRKHRPIVWSLKKCAFSIEHREPGSSFRHASNTFQISNSRFHPGAPGQVPVSHPQFPPEPIFSILPAPTAARQKLGYLAVPVKNNVVGTMPDGYAG